jgi:SAM-dependent methyltransferase
VADLPLDLDAVLADRLARAMDVEGKIPAALQALGPVADRDVILIDGATDGATDGAKGGGIRARQLTELGARLSPLGAEGTAALPDGSADVIVSMWSAFRGAPDDEVDEAARLLRPGGRLLVVHDYGRDDVAQLRGELPDHGSWSQRGGPFLGRGFRVRVIHCWWTFADQDATAAFLADAFGERGQAVSARLTRPRLSYNVAVYHRSFGETPS